MALDHSLQGRSCLVSERHRSIGRIVGDRGTNVGPKLDRESAVEKRKRKSSYFVEELHELRVDENGPISLPNVLGEDRNDRNFGGESNLGEADSVSPQEFVILAKLCFIYSTCKNNLNLP